MRLQTFVVKTTLITENRKITQLKSRQVTLLEQMQRIDNARIAEERKCYNALLKMQSHLLAESTRAAERLDGTELAKRLRNLLRIWPDAVSKMDMAVERVNAMLNEQVRR